MKTEKESKREYKEGREEGRKKGRKMRSIFLTVEDEIKIKAKSSIQRSNIYYDSITRMNSVVSSP